MINEDAVEQTALSWFEELGYEIIHGPDIAPDSSRSERASYKETILFGRLENALRRLNPLLPPSAITDAIHVLKNPPFPALLQNNHAFHRYLVEGVPVEYHLNGETRGDRVRLIDYDMPENNAFAAINQFSIEGPKNTRRPDVIVFINGLPLCVIELKDPTNQDATIYDAYNQLQTYKEQIPDLFVFNASLIISDGMTARIGSLTANEERYLPWRLKNDDGFTLELEEMIKDHFVKEHLTDYLRYFVLFEGNERGFVKKIAGYHQFHAVRKALTATITATRSGGNKKCGVVWHTQGSGKSISMTCYAAKVMGHPKMNNPTLVVVTDRNDLDGQLFEQFAISTELLRQTPEQADTRDRLKELLSGRPSGGIIFTTIQKFALEAGESIYPVLSERSNIVVIADEAHRSQYGFNAKMDTSSGVIKYGNAKYLHDALPKASFIGFTGTPVSLEDRDTRAVFGDYIDVYDIEQAVKDGATVPIYYESRLAKLDLVKEMLEYIDSEVEDLTEAEEEEGKNKTKSKWAALEALVGATPRIQKVSADLVEHFDERTASMEGKGMIVCMSREICVHMYNAITALRPDWHNEDTDKGSIKIVMTGSASDPELLRPHIYDKKTRQLFERRVKDPNDALKLVIVRDMWLTGFDAPCLHTMYIDKPMKGHGLMQAIARVNRVFRDKPGGLVVDYIGIANQLKEALKEYTASHGRGKPIVNVDEAFNQMVRNVEICRDMYHGFDYNTHKTAPLPLLPKATNYILGLEPTITRGSDGKEKVKEGKQRYADVVLAITKAHAICAAMDEAKRYKEEIAFFQAINSIINKRKGTDTKLDRDKINKAMRDIVSNSVVAEGIIDIFDAAGLKKPDISILSDDFLAELSGMKEKNLAVELLSRLIQDEVKSKMRKNKVQEKKFSDLLQASLGKYRNRAIETAQVIEELIAMAKDLNHAMQHGAQLGLNEDETAFYDALECNESAVRELGDEVLKKIAVELTMKLRENTTVDWSVRDSVRARLKIMVKQILRKYKYPPDCQPHAIETVLAQAEVLSAEWSK